VKQRIPFVQPLTPGDFLGAERETLALLAPRGTRHQLYYLARNAIWHGIKALGLKEGDEVLVPAYCHGVELDVLLARGLRLRRFRIDRAARLDPSEIASLISGDTRAIYVTHYWGFPQPIDAVRELADGRGLPLIEDCALSMFSRSGHRPLGTYGDLSIFCIYKTLPVPHGGVLVLNRSHLPMPEPPTPPDHASTAAYCAHRGLDWLDLSWGEPGHWLAGLIRATGRALKGWSRQGPILVDTNRLETRFLDLGISPLVSYLISRADADEIIERRRKNYARLLERVDPNVRPIHLDLPAGVCPHSFPILAQEKESLQARLQEEGIETVNFWSRTHPAIPEEAFPDIRFLRQHVLEIPVHQRLHAGHMDYIADALNRLARWP